MKTCYVKKINRANIPINSEVWECAEKLNINYSWSNDNAPLTYAYILYCNEGIGVKFVSYESPVEVNYYRNNDPVNRDSCVEFFIGDGTEKYLNFEINAAGVLHLQYGDENNRDNINSDIFNIFNIETEILNDCWCAKFFIPFSFLNTYFKGNYKKILRGNLFKCGDHTKSPHHICWSPVETKTVKFHDTKYFGNVILD